MKKQSVYILGLVFFAFLTVSCDKATQSDSITDEVVAVMEDDMDAVKAEIQKVEDIFGAAQTAGDIDGILSSFAEGAISMGDGEPATVGKEALRTALEESLAKRTEGNVTTYQVTDVFGSEELVTETGTSTVVDPDGNVVSKGKYMAIWEKQNGEYKCIRDIYNRDAPSKK